MTEPRLLPCRMRSWWKRSNCWQTRRGDVFPIPGTKSIKYLEENIAAFNVKLSKQEMTELEEAVPHSAVSHFVQSLNVISCLPPHLGYPAATSVLMTALP